MYVRWDENEGLEKRLKIVTEAQDNARQRQEQSRIANGCTFMSFGAKVSTSNTQQTPYKEDEMYPRETANALYNA